MRHYGSSTGLTGSPAWTYEVDAFGFGRPLAGLGDVNQDGYDDLAVGTPDFIHDVNQHGAVLLFLGSADGPARQPDQLLPGEGKFGFAVASPGDVNLDGYSDLVIGAPESSGQGAAHLFLGGPSGSATAMAWTGNPTPDAYELGWSVAPAGDVNGDGRLDLVVGDPNDTLYFYGRASVYLGAALPTGAAGALEPSGPGALVVELVNGEVALRWGASCSGPEEDYGVYSGAIGSWDSHLPLTCSTGSVASWTGTVDPGDRYFLVVPHSEDHEGSYGVDSAGNERPAASAACSPQAVDPCR
ncbi:MAG: hypothetical protein GY716_22745 [bacterium]|nr:hypothetical protein [bacterium]